MSTYYAVHRESKVHRKIDGPLDYLFGEEVRKADNEGWIKWAGGECPLPGEQMVEVRFLNGECDKEPARLWAWEVDGDYSIIAYRPVLEQEKPEPEIDWNKEPDNAWNERGELPPVGTVCDVDHKGCQQGQVEVRYMGDTFCVLWSLERQGEQCGHVEDYTFRPIKTEKERTIEAAKKCLRDNGGFYADEVVKLLYDAKMLRLPEDEI